jgi:hypothetical protein
MDSVAEKAFISLQLNHTPLLASPYLDFLIVQGLEKGNRAYLLCSLCFWAAFLTGFFLSLEVGYREHSAILQTNILNRDKFPTFFAQNVQVILNIVHDWLTGSLKMVSADARLYRDHLVFPFWQTKHHPQIGVCATVLRNLRLRI